MRKRIEDLQGESLIKEAQRRSAFEQRWHWLAHYRLKEALMVAANIIQLYYCGNAYTKAHTIDYGWGNTIRMGFLGLLACGTLVGNVFAKVPMLIDPVNGLGFNHRQKRIYRAIERGIQQSLLRPDLAVTASLTPADFEALGERGRTLTVNLLSAKYERQFVVTQVTADRDKAEDTATARPQSLGGIGGATVDGDEEKLQATSPSVNVRVPHAIEICIDHSKGKAHYQLNHSALSHWQTLCQHPGMALYYALKWSVFRLGASLAVILTINVSLHNIMRDWFGVGQDSSKAALIALILGGLSIGFYRALSANSLQNHKLYEEINVMHGMRQLKIRPSVNGCAAAQAFFPIAICFLFNVCMTMFFAEEGADALFEQLGWVMFKSAITLSGDLNGLFTGWFMFGNVGTAMSSSMIETYRNAQGKVTGKSASRQKDTSMQDHAGVWRLALTGIILDGINYGIMAAHSTEQALMKRAGPTAAFVLSIITGAGILATASYWSYSTLVKTFAGTMEGLSVCCSKKPKPESEAARDDNRIREKLLSPPA